MFALDHLVYAVLDAEASSLKFAMNHKVTTYEGGRHKNWGTYNYLSHFQYHCYIEWLSLFDQSKAKSSSNPLIQHASFFLETGQEGLMQLALRTDNMESLIEYYKKNNIPFQGPFPGSRIKPDGTILQWRMLFPEDPAGNLLPFLIEWNGPLPQPPDSSLINKQKIQTVYWGTENPAAAVQTWERMFNLQEAIDSNSFCWQLANTEIVFAHGSNLDYKLE